MKYPFLTRDGLLHGLAVLGLTITAVAPPSGAAEKTANPVRLILPDVVPAVVGHEISIYFDNVVHVPDSRQLHFDVTCNKGMQQGGQ